MLAGNINFKILYGLVTRGGIEPATVYLIGKPDTKQSTNLVQ